MVFVLLPFGEEAKLGTSLVNVVFFSVLLSWLFVRQSVVETKRVVDIRQCIVQAVLPRLRLNSVV